MRVQIDESQTSRLSAALDRKLWQVWGVVIGAFVLTTSGLSFLLPFFNAELPEFWLWSGTNVMLSVTLITMTVLLSVYAVTQQRIIIKLHARLEDARLRAVQAQGLHRSRLVAVHALSRTIGETNEPDVVFAAISSICKDVFDSDRISIMILRPTDRLLVVRAAMGHPDGSNVIGSTRSLGEGISGYVAETQEPLLLGPDYETPRFAGESSPSAQTLQSGMVVPLIVRDEVAGVISLANGPTKRTFTPDDLITLQVFADIAEYFIRQTEKSDWMRHMIKDLRESSHTEELDLSLELVS